MPAVLSVFLPVHRQLTLPTSVVFWYDCVCLRMYPPVWLVLYPPLCLSVFLSVCLPVIHASSLVSHLSVCFSGFRPDCLSFGCQNGYRFTWLSVYLSSWLYNLIVCPALALSVCLLTCLLTVTLPTRCLHQSGFLVCQCLSLYVLV